MKICRVLTFFQAKSWPAKSKRYKFHTRANRWKISGFFSIKKNVIRFTVLQIVAIICPLSVIAFITAFFLSFVASFCL